MIFCDLLKNNINLNTIDDYGDTVIQWICKAPLQGFSIGAPKPVRTFLNVLEIFSKFEEMLRVENASRNS